MLSHQLLLGVITIGPWALIIIYDFLLWIVRSIVYGIPYIGGRARGKRRPRAPSLAERPSGRPRSFSFKGQQMTGSEHDHRDGVKARILDSEIERDPGKMDGSD